MSRSEPETPEHGGAADEHATAQDRLSDYYESLLPEAQANEVKAHLEDCADCRAAYHELEEAVGALSGLHRMSAPQRFEKGVEETIRRRSAGRFFGRRALGDRIPFELLAIVALALALVIYGMLRASETGSLAPRSGGGETPTATEPAQ